MNLSTAVGLHPINPQSGVRGDVVGWIPPRRLTETTMWAATKFLLGYPTVAPFGSNTMSFEFGGSILNKTAFNGDFFGLGADGNAVFSHTFDATSGNSGGPFIAWLPDSLAVPSFTGPNDLRVPFLFGVHSGAGLKKNFAAAVDEEFIKAYNTALDVNYFGLKGLALAKSLLLPIT
ncbi:MAG: hypothetical protein AB7S68_40150 [Polyangiaceae bacterium]